MTNPMKLNSWMTALLAAGFALTSTGCTVTFTSDAAPTSSPVIANAANPTAALPTSADVTGTWQITEAKGIDGTTYTGQVDIQSLGDVYRLTWDSSIGSYKGIGFLVEDQLFVGSGTDVEEYGVGVYRIQPDGTLEGQWTLPSSEGQVGTETATKSGIGLTGTYQVQGVNPNNEGDYEGTLEIQQTGDTYQLSWEVGSDVYTGVGLRSGDWLAVSWGEPGSFGVMAFAIADNTMSGRWAVPDETQLGVENLAR
ncbi:hypothetical protein H6G89_24120 [Oscillatoria sp. FACHB-1407]|uniref:hypothetical protein n=1 Tax=Oscillatoria sp. FACHB-1407 TaxID=2692847 RepID=UPI0016822C2D|nr:hypothetical protein [Oscillatoria sp. FACHB-1407]MBD2464093.1 hypothetical protein [Oscillatoria sp. FACHB-1407]